LSRLQTLDNPIRIFDNLDKPYDDLMDLEGVIFIGKPPTESYKSVIRHNIRAINCGYPHVLGNKIPSLRLCNFFSVKLESIVFMLPEKTSFLTTSPRRFQRV